MTMVEERQRRHDPITLLPLRTKNAQQSIRAGGEDVRKWVLLA